MGRVVVKDLSSQLALKTGMSRNRAYEFLKYVFALITAALERGDEVVIRDFGKFQVVTRAPRQARNPSTGETVQVPARKSVKFKPSKTVRDKLNKT